MARGSNPFYYGAERNLGDALGQTLGRAIFGDPELRAQQELQRQQTANYAAQAAEAQAHSGLYGAQAADQAARTAARNQFGSLAQSLLDASLPQLVAAPAGADPLAPLPDPAPAFDRQGFQRSIVPFIAALAGAQENPNVGDTVQALGAYLGDDQFARRALVAGGKTPGKEFALTADRADAIAAQEYAKDRDVATINNASDIPIARIQAATAARGQDIGAATTRRGQDIGASTTRRGQDVTAATTRRGVSASPPRVSQEMLTNLFGDGTETKTEKKGELGRQLVARGYPEGLSDKGEASVRGEIISRFQQTGNPVQAVKDTLDGRQKQIDARKNRALAQKVQGYSADELKSEAREAIGRGASPQVVRQRFKSLTGQNL
ncbi:hypothetical protein [Sphingomonas alba]|uniref:Uncharacterized protein n=1 Tax=Sphingomonas alba TaxID=2908208 RepID=A0ABT0RP82_9SPHN|nr:hypothetical protein [Sphingomonas alba]MCL6684456.1 hypothetical protein [Sphingomonas alba]